MAQVKTDDPLGPIMSYLYTYSFVLVIIFASGYHNDHMVSHVAFDGKENSSSELVH